MDSQDEVRKAHNEALFREANESVRAVQEELGMPEGLMPFICECDDPACRAILRVSQAGYESVRANATHFLVVPGHPTLGELVAEQPQYNIVAKTGVSGDIAAETNPRGQSSTMDERERRIGENEILHRAVNEKIEDLNAAFGTLTESMTVVCECGDVDCAMQIDLDIAAYERIRAEATLFVIVPGHEIPDVEHVVEKGEGYAVVRKKPGGPAELAESHDPRD